MNWVNRSFTSLTGVDNTPSALMPSPEEGGDGGRLSGYGWAVFACAVSTVAGLLLRGLLDPPNLVLLYLMAVVLVSVRFGRKPGILASFLAVLTFDVFLVPPYYSLSVHDPQYLLTFAIMLAVALIISSLTANLRHQACIAHYRERRTAALFDLSKDLSAALTDADIVDAGVRHLQAMFQAEATLLLADRQGKLRFPEPGAGSRFGPWHVVLGGAQALYDREHASERDTVREITGGLLCLPLRAPMRIRGVLVIAPHNPRYCLLPEQQRLLQTCAAQIALAIERVHYVDVAQQASVAIESERLRNSLLSAISHDVRTPLTAIVGLTSTLAGAHSMQAGDRQELAEAIHDEALRMSGLVANLLDMAKLHAGGTRLNRQWQMLEEVIGSALAMLSRTLQGRCIDVRLAPDLPLLEFDAVLLERVFCNLLDNAAKYTPAGSPLSIRAAAEGAMVRVSVEDSGMGVPAELREAVFEKFMRGEPESSRSGVGLGLAICRTIIDAHGGRIRVDAGDNGGARFVFTLPIGSPPAVDCLSDTEEPAGTEGAA